VPKRLSRSLPSEAPPPDLDVSELGSLVRQKRLDEDLSVRRAAEQARVSFSTISRVEAGAQPDLATFTSLCVWLGVNPSRFFPAAARRAERPLDHVTEHLVTDPALTPDAAQRIVGVVRDLYQALAHETTDVASRPLALHLRGASVMRPGVPERLASLLKDMRTALDAPRD
jgi:transcriptional regulator with XRE-family HTH domain